MAERVLAPKAFRAVDTAVLLANDKKMVVARDFGAKSKIETELRAVCIRGRVNDQKFARVRARFWRQMLF